MLWCMRELLKNRITSIFPYYLKSQWHNSTPNNKFFNFELSNRRRKRGEREMSIRKMKSMRSMHTFIPHNLSMKDTLQYCTPREYWRRVTVVLSQPIINRKSIVNQRPSKANDFFRQLHAPQPFPKICKL